MSHLTDSRTAYISGLRELADALETFGSLPLPYDGNRTSITFHYLSGENPTDALISAALMIPCTFTSKITVHTPVDDDGSEHAYLYLNGNLSGVKITLIAYRKDTCDQVDGEWRVPGAITSVAPEAGVTG